MSLVYPPYGAVPAQPCQRCGAPLPPNEGYCARCGYNNSAAGQNQPGSNTSWGNMPPGANTPTPPQTGASWGQPVNTPVAQNGSAPNNYNPQWTPNASPARPSGQLSNAGMPFGAPNQAPPNAFPPQNPSGQGGVYPAPSRPLGGPMGPSGPVTPQPSPGSGQAWMPNMGQPSFPGNGQAPMPGGGQYAGPNYFQPSTHSQPPQTKTRGRGLKILVACVLLLVVIAAGGVGYLYLTRHTSPAIMASTDTTHSPVPTETPEGPVVFADTFANNNKSWDLQNSKGVYSASISNGTLLLEDDANRLLPEYVPGTSDKPLADFQLQFNAQLSKGDAANGYGVYIRTSQDNNSNPSNYYCIEFYGDGTYVVFKGATDTNGIHSQSKLVDYTANSAIQKQGSTNHIAITAKGSEIQIMVNGQLLKSFSDSGYKSGSIALFVSNLAGTHPGAQATFANLAIYQ